MVTGATIGARRREEARAQITDAIETRSLTTWFAPILSMDGGRTIGFEVATHGPAHGWLQSPANLQVAAQVGGCSFDLDLMSFELAVEHLASLAQATEIHFCVSSRESLGHVDFLHRLIASAHRHRIPPQCLVLEVRQDDLGVDLVAMASQFAALRRAGISVAIRDVVLDSFCVEVCQVLRPSIVKFHAPLIEPKEMLRQPQRGVIERLNAIDCEVIATSVNSSRTFFSLVGLPLRGWQGEYAGPAQSGARLRAGSLLPDAATPAAGATARLLSAYVEPVLAQTKVRDAVSRLRANPNLRTLAVVEETTVVGALRRDELFALLSRPLHSEVYTRKCVADVMETAGLVVDADTRIEHISRMLSDSGPQRLLEEFIITDNGNYLGMGRTIDLLRVLTEQQVRTARLSNPLTLLPGNALIAAHAAQLLNQPLEFVAIYFDLNTFKPFNDHYGHARGDRVIQSLAEMLKVEFADPLNFVGHVGGDDFLVLACSPDWRERACNVVARFDAAIASHYGADEVAAGGISARGRDGLVRKYSLLTISIAAVIRRPGDRSPIDVLSERVATVKSEAKSAEGHRFFIEIDGAICEQALNDSAQSAKNKKVAWHGPASPGNAEGRVQ